MSTCDQVRWIDLPSNRDDRGVLTAIECGMDIPFEVRRIFLVHDVRAPRGGHAHRDTDQILLAVSGAFEVHLFDGHDTCSFWLEQPTRGLLLPPMIFTEMDGFTPGAVVLVLANTHYDKGKSLRSRDAFLQALSAISDEGAA